MQRDYDPSFFYDSSQALNHMEDFATTCLNNEMGRSDLVFEDEEELKQYDTELQLMMYEKIQQEQANRKKTGYDVAE